MRKLRIMLGDLGYYNKYTREDMYVPLNIGYVAQYARQQFGNDVDISLYKDPAKMLECARQEKPDVLGLSFYYWNTDLNRAMTKRLRALYGRDLVIVWGGASVGTDKRELAGLFERFPDVDTFVINEGELGFANAMRALLAEGAGGMWTQPIDGAVFRREGQIVQGLPVGLTLDLGTLRSPYLNGLLDEFLDGDYLPMLQTSRLCPYTCAFCASGKNKGKLRGFPTEQVKEEIDFICNKYTNRGYMSLLLSDENFGILARDVELSEYIREKSEKIGYPRGIFFYNDKRFTDTSKKVIEALGRINTHGLILSLQSENPETLKEVKRRNLSPEDIQASLKWASDRNMPTATELIFGLPYETRDSFLDLLRSCVERGFDSILGFNLFLMDGIELNTPAKREQHGIKTMFRPVSTYYGKMDGEFCAETEEIVVSTKYFNFDDYLFIRSLNFMYYTVFVLFFYKWFFQYVRHAGIDISRFMLEFICPSDPQQVSAGHRAFSEDFRRAITEELFESREEAKEHLRQLFHRKGENVDEPIRQNVYFGARLIYMENDWVADSLRATLSKFAKREERPEVFAMAEFLLDLCQRERVDPRGERLPQPLNTAYDVSAWRKEKFARPLEKFHMDSRPINFNLSPETAARLASFQKAFAGYDEHGFFYAALDFMNRRELTYRLEY